MLVVAPVAAEAQDPASPVVLVMPVETVRGRAPQPQASGLLPRARVDVRPRPLRAELLPRIARSVRDVRE